jgi:hypothetical protein
VARRLTMAILLIAVAGSLRPGTAEAKTRAFVAKPSRITCVASHLGESTATIRCDLRFIGSKAVFLHTRGKAQIKHVSGFVHPHDRSTLGRGAQAKLGPFTCQSLKAAVTCHGDNGHGFTVGRKFQLTY